VKAYIARIWQHIASLIWNCWWCWTSVFLMARTHW